MVCKRCTKCGKIKPVLCFYPRIKGKDEVRSRCKDCLGGTGPRTERQKKLSRLSSRRRRHRLGEAGKRAARLYLLGSLYGLTEKEYNLLLAAQGGVCAICKQPETKIVKRKTVASLCVDHNHVTGKMRGLLCTRCNLMVGNAEDNPDRLRQAANYLEDKKK